MIGSENNADRSGAEISSALAVITWALGITAGKYPAETVNAMVIDDRTASNFFTFILPLQFLIISHPTARAHLSAGPELTIPD